MVIVIFIAVMIMKIMYISIIIIIPLILITITIIITIINVKKVSKTIVSELWVITNNDECRTSKMILVMGTFIVTRYDREDDKSENNDNHEEGISTL